MEEQTLQACSPSTLDQYYIIDIQLLKSTQKHQQRNKVFDCDPSHSTKLRSSAGLLYFKG